VKQGTLQLSDLQDLKAMYPEGYNIMAQKLSNEIANATSNENMIPYHARLSVSLFLGQPLDSTMNPSAIVAAQPVPKPPQEQGPVKGSGKSTKSLGKSNDQYKTANQAAESDRLRS
jgi:hypothetical protein